MSTACDKLKCHTLKVGAVAAAPADEETGTMGNETDAKQDSIGGKL